VIRQAVWQSRATGRLVQTAKGGTTGRVAISPELAEHLSAWYEESVIRGGASPAGLVWPGKDGRSPMSLSSILRAHRAPRSAGGPRGRGGAAHPHAHRLRHSAGSIGLANGVPLPVVSARLRHARPDFTARTYSRMLGDAELDRFAGAHRPPADHAAGGAAAASGGTDGRPHHAGRHAGDSGARKSPAK
jgi:integrase